MSRIAALGDAERARRSAQYFKTGPGEYAEGDRFLGLELRDAHALVKELWRDTSLAVCEELLKGDFHEFRTVALDIMVRRFQKGDEVEREAIVRMYLANTARVNNWDLVDMSAHKILGAWLENMDRSLLYSLARSELLWERRIAIISTFHYTDRRDFVDALAIAELLLGDRHDLIHKATGWVLREVGKKDEATLCRFLDLHATKMPRTALRYSLEKFQPERRKYYMALR